MKIEVKYKDKHYHNPNFKFFWNKEKDNFGIGVLHDEIIDYSYIGEDILNNFENFEIENSSLLYFTKEHVYLFDLDVDLKLLPIGKAFNHTVVLLDENGKIIKNIYKTIQTKLYENNYK